jgi:acyl carrier protein
VTNDGIKTRIGAFLARAFPDRALGMDEDIFALGFGNSLFAMQLVDFVEREFGVGLDESDLDIDNFRSIDAIARLVAGKTPELAR